MDRLAFNPYRFFLKRKSQIYSAITALPIAVFTSQNHFAIQVALGLALITLFVFALPKYVSFGTYVEDLVNKRLAQVTVSRFIRIFFQAPFVFAVCKLIETAWGTTFLGPVVFMLLLGASNGLHAMAVTLAYRGYGDRIGNILLSLSISAWLIAVLLIYSYGLLAAGLLTGLFIVYLATGILSDLRAVLYPKRGVGVFFGTFNPIHKTHLRIMKEAIENRGLHKIYIHSTTVPKLHRTALANGEIAITWKAGMRVYEKTSLADQSKNYFPTGNKFYEYEVRKELIKASIKDEGLEDKVEVLDIPDVYEHSGFFGVLRYIKSKHKGSPVHGLHGSDTGGIWVRNIFDLCGWIYPCPIIRKDDISATAIREGATGYTSKTVEEFLAATRAEKEFIFPSGFTFKNSGNSTH